MPDDTRSSADTLGPDDLTSYLVPGEASGELEFDEDLYLRAYADVADAVERGELTSGFEHYLRAGRAERRLARPEYVRQVAQHRRATAPASAPTVRTERVPTSIDALVLSDSGAVFLVGWTDDRHNRLVSITLGADQASARTLTSFPRLRRLDVEASLQSSSRHHYGFWLLSLPAAPQHAVTSGGDWRVELRFADGSVVNNLRIPTVVSDTELRDTAMAYFASCEYLGNRWAEAFNSLDTGVGDTLITFNRMITRSITGHATADYFGPRRKRFQGSIVVPLYGIADYMFVQSCACADGPGIENYEFIYVVNSPELIERLHREARIGETVYGLSQTLVYQSGNAGFGAANNVALRFACSDRILCMNPDVFPRQADWAQRHTALLGALPASQTRLFGTTLYYDDGSLMHGGMYLDTDTGVRAGPDAVTQRKLLRVEHYGKGAPPWATAFTASRPVPAVTGAFMSIDRAWFEKLGGFTEDFIFGHYEDADLCLKSLKAGAPVWLHDLGLWHLEGKGSRRLPAHEGGTLVNRWVFTRNWLSFVTPDLLGRQPRRNLLAAADAAAAVPAKVAPRGRVDAATRRASAAGA